MSFSIRHSKEKDLDLVYITDESTNTEVALLPACGSILHAFRVRQPNGALFNVIDNYRDAGELVTELNKNFKGPKLSPFVCRIPDGKYRFEDKEYRFHHLFPDGTAIHGLLYDKPFTVLEEAADSGSGAVAMEYRYEKDDQGYPFDYNCRVSYLLRPGNLLEITTTVTNLDDSVIPIADGWHPYFQLGGKIDDWQLLFHSDAIVEFDEQLIPTGNLLPYDRFGSARLLGDSFFDNCFALKPGIVSAACEIYNPANGLRISFFPDAGYPYLQIYTPPARNSIAVENLSGAPDCFNNKMGLLLLPPGHSQIFTVGYKVGVH
jgi:aldose 1-epimerase